MTMQVLLRSLFAIAVLSAAAAPSASASHGPQARHVLIVSVDGLRPDLLLRARAPNLRRLMSRGSYTMWAQTTAVAVTLPSHVSMLTGVSPSRHGIEWNSNLPLSRPVFPKRPTLFELAHDAGLTTAMVAGKSKFGLLARPGSLEWWYVPVDTVVSDVAVTDTASRIIELHRPEVMFVHLPGVDTAGHAHGWGSDAQIAAVEGADRCIGRLLAMLDRRRLLDSTVVFVTSDHGGAGKTHGPDDPRSRFVPWILAGPGVRRGLDLTTDAALMVRIEDTFATACLVLQITIPPDVEGHPVAEAFSEAGSLFREARSNTNTRVP